MASIRCERVSTLLQKEIGEILLKGLRDPRIGFVTVTGVEVTKDMRSAKVFVSILGDALVKKETMEALHHARPYIQNQLGTRIRLRFMPILHFYLDESGERGARIESLIQKLHLETK